jgi:hypothetical protein
MRRSVRERGSGAAGADGGDRGSVGVGETTEDQLERFDTGTILAQQLERDVTERGDPAPTCARWAHASPLTCRRPARNLT